MSISPQQRTSAHMHMLGDKVFSFARSRLPVPNQSRTRHRRAFLTAAPIPFAPLIDTHTFQPPPPYTPRLDDTAEFLPVPYNTPEKSTTTVGLVLTSGYVHPIGLGLEGVEKGDGGPFDGLGRLSGGFRGGSTGDVLREQVHRMLTEHSQRRRTRAREQPKKRHDVFYASVEVQSCDVAQSVPARTIKIRIRRKSVASPTPSARRWDDVRRGTISSELKRAASLERRMSLSEMTNKWRV